MVTTPDIVTTIDWGLIIVGGLVGLVPVIAIVLLALNESTRKTVQSIGMILLAIVGFVGYLLLAGSSSTKVAQLEQPSEIHRNHILETKPPAIQLPALPDRPIEIVKEQVPAPAGSNAESQSGPIVSSSAKISADQPSKPDWVDKPPHWEGDVYIVPVASDFHDSSESYIWEGPMDAAAKTELEEATAAMYSMEPIHNSHFWEMLYVRVKYKIWGPQRYLETVSIPIAPQPRYQMHGLLRIDPAIRRILEKEIAKFTGSSVEILQRRVGMPIKRLANGMPVIETRTSVIRDRWETSSVLLILIVLGIVLVVLYGNPNTRRGVAWVAGCAVIALLISALFWGEERHDVGGVPSVTQLHNVTIPHVVDQVASEPTKNPDEIKTSVDTTKTADATDPTRPSWVDQPPQLQGNIYRLPVKSGLFVTKRECQKAVDAKTRLAVNDYIDELIEPGAARKISPDANFMRQLQKELYAEVVTSTKVGPMQQVHVLIEFDDMARADLVKRWNAVIVSHRLGLVAIAASMVLGLLAIAFGYLKLDLQAAGQSRSRLRLAAVGAIILLATSAAVAFQALQL
jgi:hypothetical protein